MGAATVEAHEYTVVGAWPFPLDMLRRDGSHPASRKDRLLIERLSGSFCHDKGDMHDEVEIRLKGPNKPNTARWESFKWKVPGDTLHAAYKALVAKAARDAEIRKGALAKLTEEERRVLFLTNVQD